MNNYSELVKSTYIENWPKELCSLSVVQVGIILSRKEMEIICSNMLELNDCFNFPKWQSMKSLEDRIDKEICKFPKGAFVRLGSRSAKDCLYESNPLVYTGKEALKRLCACSERIYEDLSMALNYNYNAYIWLREWQEIPEWAEFRCFMKDRKLVGISQYNYLNGVIYSEIAENKESLIHLILGFFDNFKKVSHLDNVIFDVFVKLRKIGNQNHWEIKLLEINPYFELTDPCLFDWRRPEDFNGEFRYNK